MPITLFSYVDLYRRLLITADHLLGKGVEHARAQGVDEATLLGWRLIDDMQPVAFQLKVICDFTRQWPARVMGVELPTAVAPTLDVAGFRAAIADAIAYLDGLTEDQFAGRDEVPLTVPIGDETMKPTLPAGQWLSVFASTNLYFHVSTLYGILRAHGVPLGKIDMFASGL